MDVGFKIGRSKQVRSGLWMLGLLLVFIAAACTDGLIRPTETRDESLAVGDSVRVVVIVRTSGTFEVEKKNGRIQFDGEIDSGSSNRMTTSNGDVKLQGTSSVKFDASSGNGSVNSRLPILTTSSADTHHLVGTIGAGDAALFIKTSNESVLIQ